jgi:hypothetical protein
MTGNQPKRKLSRGQIALMIAIDVVALIVGIGLYLFFQKHDPGAAIFALAAPLVFGGFFNLVIVLVTLKP